MRTTTRGPFGRPVPPRLSGAVLCVLLAGAAPGRAAAQGVCASSEQCPGQVLETGWQQELTAAGINALLGGMTAAAGRILRGEPAWGSFWKGAAGGGAIYAGKRVAVEGFDGAGLLGREIASVGSSVVRNAARGGTVFEEVVLPVGPVRLYWSADGVMPRLDVATVAATAAMMVSYDARIDPLASLSNGAVVLRGHSLTPGLSSAGAILTWEDMPRTEGPRLLAHERVHILQYDQAFHLWTEAPERWLVRQSPVGSRVLDHLDFGGLALGMRMGLNTAMDYESRPWEREAYLLSQFAHPVPGPAGL